VVTGSATTTGASDVALGRQADSIGIMLSRLRTPEEDASPGTGQTETIAGDGRAWDMEPTWSPKKPPSPLLGAGLFQVRRSDVMPACEASQATNSRNSNTSRPPLLTVRWGAAWARDIRAGRGGTSGLCAFSEPRDPVMITTLCYYDL